MCTPVTYSKVTFQICAHLQQCNFPNTVCAHLEQGNFPNMCTPVTYSKATFQICAHLQQENFPNTVCAHLQQGNFPNMCTPIANFENLYRYIEFFILFYQYRFRKQPDIRYPAFRIKGYLDTRISGSISTYPMHPYTILSYTRSQKQLNFWGFGKFLLVLDILYFTRQVNQK